MTISIALGTEKGLQMGTAAFEDNASSSQPTPQNNPSTAERWADVPLHLTQQGGEAFRDVKALNAGLTRAHSTHNKICWTLARVRIEFFRCTPARYETLLGKEVASWAILSERPSPAAEPRYHLEYFSKLFTIWSKVSQGNEDLTKKLDEAKTEILNSLPNPKWSPTFKLYYRWRAEVGPEKFDKLTGLSFSQLWSRQRHGNETSMSEMMRVARQLKLIPDHLSSKDLLKHTRTRDSLAAWCEEGIAHRRLPPMVELMGLLNFSWDRAYKKRAWKT